MVSRPKQFRMGAWVFIGLCSLMAIACVKARINVVDERTALENQILGSYQELDRDLQMVASVRSVDAEGQSQPAPSFHQIRQQAIEARQTQQFNQDDIDELKLAGCLGEGADGLLHTRPCEAGQDAPVAERIARQLKSENASRETLLEFVVTTSPDLTRDDLKQVRTAYARMNRDASSIGHWIQSEDGTWSRKP